ncbi:MAG: LacI family DNA-binding transcriptional regulator [Planctomycetota bacterium]|nr:LacI family DNA-binding transcriptional regulator [Planctomycetota bacterium]
MAKVTLQQVADKVGVSAMTVSYVLRGGGRIGRLTRERVLLAATELGYHPRPGLWSERRRRMRCAALLTCCDRQANYLPPDLLCGIQQALDPHEIVLAMGTLPINQPSSMTALPRVLGEDLADGLLINCSHPIPGHLTQAISTGRTPAVWMNCKLDSDCVYPDDRAAARALTRELLARGHRRLLYIADEAAPGAFAREHASELEKLAGFSEEVSVAGLLPQVFQSGRAEAGGESPERLRALLASPGRPTALVANNASAARLAVATCELLGLHAPADLAIHAFTLWSDGQMGHGVQQHTAPLLEMGRRAAEMLLAKVERPGVKQAALGVPYVAVKQEKPLRCMAAGVG